MRIHNGDNEIDLKTKYSKTTDFTYSKPVGLWYSIDYQWVEWAKNNMKFKLKKNNYSLDLDESKLLIIKTTDAIFKLFDDYGKRLIPESNLILIDWAKLRSDYSGFEIINLYDITSNTHSYRFTEVMKLMSFKSFDVDSGCIWDLSIIKNIKLLNNE